MQSAPHSLLGERVTLAWSGPAGDRFGMQERPWPPAAQALTVLRHEPERVAA